MCPQDGTLGMAKWVSPGLSGSFNLNGYIYNVIYIYIRLYNYNIYIYVIQLQYRYCQYCNRDLLQQLSAKPLSGSFPLWYVTLTMIDSEVGIFTTRLWFWGCPNVDAFVRPSSKTRAWEDLQGEWQPVAFPKSQRAKKANRCWFHPQNTVGVRSCDNGEYKCGLGGLKS